MVVKWFLTKLLLRVLLTIGIKGTLAGKLVPIILETFNRVKIEIDLAKVGGATDNEALAAAADVILPPNHPDRKTTIEDIARGNPA